MKLTCCVHVDLMLISLLEYLKSLASWESMAEMLRRESMAEMLRRSTVPAGPQLGL